MGTSNISQSLGVHLPNLAYDAIHSLAQARGTTASALVRDLVERELAENSAEVSAAMAVDTRLSMPVRRAMEEAFPRAKVLAEHQRFATRVASRGG